jgi:Holliday junction DNA helicase RuvA
MIGYLRGTVLSKTTDRVLLDVQGVGYEVHIPVSTYYELEKLGADSAAALHIHTHLRDDGLSLFGFWTLGERQLFEKLIAVGGIGPKLARVILSGMSPGDLVAALAAGDLARLSSIPGVGKKTAERMVLELRDKLRDLEVETPSPAGPADDDLVSALVNLGYKQTHAARAVQAARNDTPDADFSDLLRASLKRLSRA